MFRDLCLFRTGFYCLILIQEEETPDLSEVLHSAQQFFSLYPQRILPYRKTILMLVCLWLPTGHRRRLVLVLLI